MKDREIMKEIDDIIWSKSRGLKLDWEQEVAVAYIRTMSLSRKMSIAKRYIKKSGYLDRAVRTVNLVFELTLPYTFELKDESGVIL